MVSTSAAAVVRVGPAGWSYPDWVGPVYPRRRPSGFHPLAFLARYVDCVEVNSTFYAVPAARNTARWLSLVEQDPDFRFVAKLERTFTHEPWDPAALPGRARDFLAGLAPLTEAGRLAALLVQFPVGFRDGAPARDRIARVRDLFGSMALVLEVRHRSWFEPGALEHLAALGYALAHLDLPAARDHPPERHPSLGTIGYLRLHGRNAASWFSRSAGRDARYDWLYAPSDLSAFAERARDLAGETREVYVVTNNHYGGKALANAIELRSLLEQRSLRAPAPLLEAFPRLRDVAHADGQDVLF